MKEIYCGESKKYKEPKITYICDEVLLSFSFSDKYESEDEKTFKYKESNEIIIFFDLINDM